MIYNILEVANTHGGNLEYFKSLIEEFEEFEENTGIKFQPFKYNQVALKDYSWYKVYEELFFSPDQWEEIILMASKHKDIWIDVFDGYSIEIIKNNIERIYGFKIQASVLYNKNVLKELTELPVNNKKIILNISGFEMDEIEEVLSRFNRLFEDSEILLQIGFQGYPTKIEDSGILKIKKIKARFKNRTVFADHIDADNEDSIWLPVFAALEGVDMIEKHVKHSTLDTKYDFYSSLAIGKYKEYIERLEKYTSLHDKDFIPKEELIYLEKSQQIPVLNKSKNKGSFLSWDDFDFKRTDCAGLNTKQLEKLLKEGYYLTTKKEAESTIIREDLSKATIATIIAVRLKSSRLKEKALKNIGSIASIEYCIKNALKFENVNHTILATSDLESDKELEHFTYNADVVFHKGDPEDVIKRYLDIARQLKVDIIIRVTGDMPFVSDEVLQILLKSHFETGSDYTTGKEAAVGTNLEVINTQALEKVQEHFPTAHYSEYMTWYFQNNPEYFSLNFVDLPKDIIRDYRLTLDYEEDLQMFNIIEKYFTDNGLEYSIRELFEFLDNNPKVAEINSNLTLTYRTDTELIDTLNRVTKIME